jgi:dTDP-4-dehydrorhamnose 3,5-epimerase
MEFIKTEIPEIVMLNPKVVGDERGFVLETFRANQFAQACSDLPFVQDNHSGSVKNTLRGLHYQVKHTQGKLIRVVIGEIFDVAVDIRRSSPTFGKWVGMKLSAKNRLQLWIPPRFAHGFLVLSDWAEVTYKATDYYAPEFERSLAWNDPQIGINWPFQTGQSPILSEKDQLSKPLHMADLFD